MARAMADLQRRITKSGEVRWDVRYRDQARGQRKRSFERKVDAQRFARAVETDLLRGDWIDPRRSREGFQDWAAKWLETLGSRKPKTRESYESIVTATCCPGSGRFRSGRSTTRSFWRSSPTCSARVLRRARSATFATCCASSSGSP